MKIKQFTNLPCIATSLKIVAASSLAMAAATTLSSAPASAITINGGELNFTGGTTNLSSLVSPNAPASFVVDFNQPSSNASVFAATGDFASFFPQIKPAIVPLTTTPSTFSLVSTTPTSFLYRLDNTLAFNFGNISLNVGQNSIFTGMYNNLGGVDFILSTIVGSTFFTANDSVNTPINALSFSFGDNGLSGLGNYRISASPTAIPEPFTVIGTIIGGTAAFRMRKKLSSSAKN